MSPAIRRLLIGLLVLAGAAFVATRFITHNAPAGQPPLGTLDAITLAALRDDFNRAVNDTRIIVLLAPT